MESKVFDVEAAGLTLQFEFYTFDSIQEDLKKIFGDQVKQYNMSIYKKWSQIRQDQDKDRETKFFTYIKFFIEKKTNKTYGLIFFDDKQYINNTNGRNIAKYITLQYCILSLFL